PNKVELISRRQSTAALNSRENERMSVVSSATSEAMAEQTAQLYERILASKTGSTVIKSRPMLVKSMLGEASALFQLTADTLCADIAEAAQALSDSIKKGAKILVCGHGDSGAGIQHF